MARKKKKNHDARNIILVLLFSGIGLYAAVQWKKSKQQGLEQQHAHALTQDLHKTIRQGLMHHPPTTTPPPSRAPHVEPLIIPPGGVAAKYADCKTCGIGEDIKTWFDLDEEPMDLIIMPWSKSWGDVGAVGW